MSGEIMNRKFKKTMLLVIPVTLFAFCNKSDQSTTTSSRATAATPTPNVATPADASLTTSSANSNSTAGSSSASAQPLASNSTTEGLDAKGILSKIHDANQMEISMGQMAKSHGKAKAVKDFGNTLIKDHSDADKKVMDVAKKESITLVTPKAMNEIEKQKMQEHQELMGRLHVLKGAEFDKVFVQAMIDGHNDTISFLESSNSSDANVKALVSDILPTVRGHERTATLISQELKLK